MTFKDMKVYNGEGSQITPSWSASGRTKCDGTLTVVDPATITIEHSTS